MKFFFKMAANKGCGNVFFKYTWSTFWAVALKPFGRFWA